MEIEQILSKIEPRLSIKHVSPSHSGLGGSTNFILESSDEKYFLKVRTPQSWSMTEKEKELFDSYEKDFLFNLYRPRKDERNTLDDFTTEIKVLNNWKNIVPSPKIIETDADQFILLSYSSGKPLSKLIQQGKYDVSLHNKVLDALETLLTVSSYQKDTYYVHNDLHVENILASTDKVEFIDPGIGVKNISYDLLSACTNRFFINSTLGNFFMDDTYQNVKNRLAGDFISLLSTDQKDHLKELPTTISLEYLSYLKSHNYSANKQKNKFNWFNSFNEKNNRWVEKQL